MTLSNLLNSKSKVHITRSFTRIDDEYVHSNIMHQLSILSISFMLRILFHMSLFRLHDCDLHHVFYWFLFNTRPYLYTTCDCSAWVFIELMVNWVYSSHLSSSTYESITNTQYVLRDRGWWRRKIASLRSSMGWMMWELIELLMQITRSFIDSIFMCVLISSTMISLSSWSHYHHHIHEDMIRWG